MNREVIEAIGALAKEKSISKEVLFSAIEEALKSAYKKNLKKAPGRGAYVCPSKECLTRAVKQRQLERALEMPVGEAVYAQLMEQVEAHD